VNIKINLKKNFFFIISIFLFLFLYFYVNILYPLIVICEKIVNII